MKRLLLPFIFFGTISASIAQVETATDSVTEGWTRAGNISLLFNQAAFNHEWTGGGTSNYAGNISLTYDFNYKKDKMSWNNKILADYGITKNKDDKYSRKTNDRLEFNSILGRQIRESNWYKSLFLNFKSQFTKGYEFNDDLQPNEEGYRTETTHFLSPAYIQFGPGLLWKESDNLYVNISPATAKFILVDKDFTAVDESVPGALDAYNANKYFGVDANETSRFEFGASLSAYAKFDVMPNISAENNLNLYSNYLDDPKNVDLDYTFNLVMKVNKYISSHFTFQAIYDDNAVQGFQIREALGIGVTYGF